jgi:Undecaprenyl-phosphate galactose phosphotransferase WbaP
MFHLDPLKTRPGKDPIRPPTHRPNDCLAEVIPLGIEGRVPAPQRAVTAHGAWFLSSDLLALFLAFLAGGLLAGWNNPSIFSSSAADIVAQFGLFLSLGIVAILRLDAKGHYRHRLPSWEELGHVASMVVLGFIGTGFIQFALKSSPSRLWLAASWGLFGLFAYGGRCLIRRLFQAQGRWTIPSIMIGCGPTAKAARKALADEPAMGYALVAELTSDKMADLVEPSAWAALLDSLQARHIFLALEGPELETYRDAIKALGRAQVPYALLPSWAGLPLRGLSRHDFVMYDVMLLQNTNPLHLLLPRLLKRGFDIVGAIASLLLFSPVFLATAIAARADGGPALFRQPRVGRNGRPFACFKFRSMRQDAESVLARYLAEDSDIAVEWEKYQKLRDDPRLTRFGSFMRKTSLDELPQLFNVLRGDMSLVGPRPILPGQENYYGNDFEAYCSVRPGITGPWQVSGRNRLTFGERVRLEAWYTRNWTFWLDIVILIKTIPALCRHETAF